MFSDELRAFVVDRGYNYKNNGTTEEIPVDIELSKAGNTETYSATVEIEDRYSQYESNTLYINSFQIKQKLLYEKFISKYYDFEYENNCLKFMVNGYQVTIS